MSYKARSRRVGWASCTARSTAEVIARLDVIGELPPEQTEQAERLARSFLTTPRFTGRVEHLEELARLGGDAKRGCGALVLIESERGMGRTRLLDEACLRSRMGRSTVLWADGSENRAPHGTSQALVLRLFDQLPELVRARIAGFGPALQALGPAVLGRARLLADSVTASLAAGERGDGSAPPELAELFAAVSSECPIVVAVDNLEDVDDASLGLLVSLASIASRHALLLIANEARRGSDKTTIGQIALRRHAHPLALLGLTAVEMRALTRSMFGDASNQERFSDWLHERAAGSPLQAIEICRRLLRAGTIRYSSGLWTLPMELPDAEVPAALGDMLGARLSALSAAARSLAECLSLQRGQPTLELCRVLCEGSSEIPAEDAEQLLAELERAEVINADSRGYRFSSSALRGALVNGMQNEWGARERNHRRLGAAFERLATDSDAVLQLEAGFHYIQGDDDLRGARMIARVAHDSFKVRTLSAGHYPVGRPLEAALHAFRRHRRSVYERMPLLAALAQSGYYDARRFSDQYGDEALDVLESLSGLQTARSLRPFLGKALGLVCGIALGYLRFRLATRHERPQPYAFSEIFVNLFSTVTTVTGVAALSLDAGRAQRVAAVLEPFAVLPERLTPVGIYQFCKGLAEIGRENGVVAFGIFEELRRRFEDPKYYPTLPPEGRKLYVAAAHFARGTFALFRVRGQDTLQSADALDATGLRMYAMIASQRRFLYFAARGEFERAEPHRARVELHAAHLGNVWQVETWEAALLTLIQTTCMGDVLGATRIVHRLEELSRSVPSLKRYRQLAIDALAVVHKDRRHFNEIARRYAADEPRSYIGWAAIMSGVVRGYNELGEYREAKQFGERTLAHVTEQDRELIVLFLNLEIQVAQADAGLGDIEAALFRIDGLLRRFADCDHPLLHGLLHEARAWICFNARRFDEVEHSRSAVERWFRRTGTPALIAKCERLAALTAPGPSPTSLPTSPANDQQLSLNDDVTVTKLLSEPE